MNASRNLSSEQACDKVGFVLIYTYKPVHMETLTKGFSEKERGMYSLDLEKKMKFKNFPVCLQSYLVHQLHLITNGVKVKISHY